jgi:hypothetical protein
LAEYFVFAVLYRGEIYEAGFFLYYAELRGFSALGEYFCGLDQRFGGNTSGIQASAAYQPALY